MADDQNSWLTRAAQGAWSGATADAAPADVQLGPPRSDSEKLADFLEWAVPAAKQTVAHPIDAMGALAQWARANPEKVGGLLGGMVNPTSGPTQAGIAFHGTPTIFKPTARNPLGEFSNDYMGSGANAQMYGWGHYAAQQRPIADSFRKMLATPKVVLKDKEFAYPDTPVARIQRDPEMLAWFASKEAARLYPSAPFTNAMRQVATDKFGSIPDPVKTGALNRLAEWNREGASVHPGGALYHVDIPDQVIGNMLDWDKELSKQPLHVQGGVKYIFNQKIPQMFKEPESTFNGWVEGANEKSIYGDINDYHHLPGGAIHQMLKRGFRNRRASEALQEAGIPGIKLLDDYSKGFADVKNPTRNFVIFDPKNAKIVDKEARGGLVKGGGAIHRAAGGAVQDEGSWLGRAASGAWQGLTSDAGPVEQADFRGQPSGLETLRANWPAIKDAAQHPLDKLAQLKTWVAEHPNEVGAMIGGMANPTGGPAQAAGPLAKTLSARDAAFHALADAQRGLPEAAMLKAQHAAQLPDRTYPESYNALTHAMEHVGDLTHRMAEKYRGSNFGKELVEGKVRTGLRVTGNPVDAKRIAAINPDQWPELEAYAKEHEKLPVYNEAQRAARDAAVHLGRLNMGAAHRELRKLQDMLDNGTYEQIAGSYDPHFEWLKDPKNPDKPLKVYRGVVGGKEGPPEAALRGEPRERYSAFMSTSPHVANTYGTPDMLGSMTGAIAPLHLGAHTVHEFPTKTYKFTDGTDYKTFDKFEFDRRAQRLAPGEALAVRDVVDMGPWHSPDKEHQRLASFPSDIYAIGKGTKTKPGFKGGGAIMKALKRAK